MSFHLPEGKSQSLFQKRRLRLALSLTLNGGQGDPCVHQLPRTKPHMQLSSGGLILETSTGPLHCQAQGRMPGRACFASMHQLVWLESQSLGFFFLVTP